MTDERSREQLIEHILHLGETAFRDLFPMLPTEWLHVDLTMPQLKVVLLLFLGGPTRMSVVASGLGVTLATATGVVDRLVEKELVFRQGDPNDRRVVLCHLSRNGQTLISDLWHLARDRAKELLEAVAPAQLLLLNEALQVLVQAGQVTNQDMPGETGAI